MAGDLLVERDRALILSMARIKLTGPAQEQIADTLRFTYERFGPSKAREYMKLLDEAQQALASEPRSGRSRSDIHEEAWTYHIGQPGRRARHLFLYRILDEGEVVEIVALLHDAMDLPRRWPGRR